MSLCECGHPKEEHRFASNGESWCMAKVKVGNNRDFCPCEEFKQKENETV